MKPSETYKIATSSIAPCMAARNWDLSKGFQGSLYWTMKLGDQIAILDLRCHKGGYLPPIGSSLWFKIGVHPSGNYSKADYRTCLSNFFTEQERSDGHSIQVAIINKILAQTDLDQFQQSTLCILAPNLQRKLSKPPAQNNEWAYHFLDEDDVIRWARFFESILPRVTPLIEETALSLPI